MYQIQEFFFSESTVRIKYLRQDEVGKGIIMSRTIYIEMKEYAEAIQNIAELMVQLIMEAEDDLAESAEDEDD